MTAARELVRSTLDVVGVKEVRCDKGLTAGEYFFVWRRKRISPIENRIFVHHRIISAVKRVESVNHGISYIVLRGCWCNILNAYTPTVEKSDVSKDSFYEELEQVYNHFLSTI